MRDTERRTAAERDTDRRAENLPRQSLNVKSCGHPWVQAQICQRISA
jgi:hypothetical protein